MLSNNHPHIEGVPHFDVIVTKSTADTHVKLFIGEIKKTWDVSKLKKMIYNGGFTNILIGYYVVNSTSKVYDACDIFLLRVYGANTDLIINRSQELQNFVELAKNKMAPTLHCTFSNGYCYEYIQGKICSTEDFKDENIIKLSAHCMARFHSIKLSDTYLNHYQMEASVFSTIDHYINLIPERYLHEEQQEKFKTKVPSIEVLRSEVGIMIEAITHLQNKSIAFCHNDLNIPNLIYNEKDNIMHCIDYEYASPNYAAYDIANHFNEFAGNDEIDFKLLPSRQTQLWWLREYLEKCREISGSETSVTENAVEELYIHVSYFSLVSHLLWGVWALVQAYCSQIDFDYIGCGIVRLNEYFASKDDILSLKLDGNIST